jgi:hypothetical protein
VLRLGHVAGRCGADGDPVRDTWTPPVDRGILWRDGGRGAIDDDAPNGRRRHALHCAFFLLAMRSTVKLRRITITSSTNAAAYAFSGAPPSPEGELF